MRDVRVEGRRLLRRQMGPAKPKASDGSAIHLPSLEVGACSGRMHDVSAEGRRFIMARTSCTKCQESAATADYGPYRRAGSYSIPMTPVHTGPRGVRVRHMRTLDRRSIHLRVALPLFRSLGSQRTTTEGRA